MGEANASAPAPVAGTPANLRDLGGLPLVLGGAVRAGILYRGDAPYEGDVVAQVATWPPRLVIDLRSAFEVDPANAVSRSYPWPASTRAQRTPLLRRAAPSEQHGSLVELYDEMLGTCGPSIAAILHDLVDSPYPALIHCAAGKDRTGVTVAVLLLAAGVEPEAVVEDYRRTAPNMAGVLERVRYTGRHLPSELPAHLLETPEDAIRRVVDRMAAHDGGAAGWLAEHGATSSDLAAWTARLAG
jgi:hypothetical protein